MIYKIIIGKDFTINLNPSDKSEEIAQNVCVLLNTPKFTIPLARNIGLSGDIYGKPLEVAETLLRQEVMDLLEQYEPRAVLEDIICTHNVKSGKIIAEVVISDGQ